jgi:hypothetical protein
MALLHPSSAPAAVSDLNLFTLPPTQTAIEKKYYVDAHPISQLTGSNGPVEFVMPGDGPDYVDMSQSRLKAKYKIVHNDATSSVLAADEVAVAVNLGLQTLFSQVDVTLGGKLMTPATAMYPYKSYFQILLNYGKEAKESQLTSQGYYYEKGEDMEKVDPAGNDAVFRKNPLFKGSKVVDFEGPPARRCLPDQQVLTQQRGVKGKTIPHTSRVLCHGDC